MESDANQSADNILASGEIPDRKHARLPSLTWLLIYFACYFVCSLVVQLDPDAEPPWKDGSPIEYFTGSLLWASSILSLLIAECRHGGGRKIWLAISAGFAVLAMDEMFLLHEHSVKLVGNDDHWKLAQWIVTAAGLLWLVRRESASQETRWAWLLGYLVHTVYVAIDFGDGDYYTITFASAETLGWMEEYLELTALSCYFSGLLYLFTSRSFER